VVAHLESGPDLVADPRARSVVLHIGADKTGTTTIQQLLRHNRRLLRDRDILYPRSPGRVRHAELGLFAQSDEVLVTTRDWLRGDYPEPRTFRRRLRRRLLREVAESGSSRVVLSDEALYRMPSESIARLRALVSALADQVQVVVYLRRQDDHLVSRYQQAVKVGAAVPLEVWATRDFSDLYDYATRLRTWQDELRPDALVVRPFERARFPGGSLEADFLAAAAPDVPYGDLRPITVRNESLGAEGVEVLRLLNLHRIENQGQQVWQISNRSWVKGLRGVHTGPQLTLPQVDLDRFMEQWAASNRRVAVEHLGELNGELFRAPRKTADTTTDQVLDPARLDHYLELLQIPESEHDAIRRLAEREASR
jgi:hypothetical protein